MKQDAISKFYNEYSKEVYFYIFSLSNDHHLAQDITQETFIKAILSLEMSHGNVKAWLFKVARNLWIDHIRKNKNLAETNLEEIQVEDTSSQILEGIIKTEESLKLYNSIMKINQSMREAIILYYYLEIPQSKIGEIMKISHGSVRTLIYRGKKVLKDMMEGIDNEI